MAQCLCQSKSAFLASSLIRLFIIQSNQQKLERGQCCSPTGQNHLAGRKRQQKTLGMTNTETDMPCCFCTQQQQT
jgi:hypothetical protein